MTSPGSLHYIVLEKDETREPVYIRIYIYIVLLQLQNCREELLPTGLHSASMSNFALICDQSNSWILRKSHLSILNLGNVATEILHL